MSLRNLWSLSGGILIGLLVYGFFFLLFLFSGFNLAGGETLDDMEQRQVIWLTTAVILFLMALVFVWYQNRAGRY